MGAAARPSRKPAALGRCAGGVAFSSKQRAAAAFVLIRDAAAAAFFVASFKGFDFPDLLAPPLPEKAPSNKKVSRLKIGRLSICAFVSGKRDVGPGHAPPAGTALTSKISTASTVAIGRLSATNFVISASHAYSPGSSPKPKELLRSSK